MILKKDNEEKTVKLWYLELEKIFWQSFAGQVWNDFNNFRDGNAELINSNIISSTSC